MIIGNMSVSCIFAEFVRTEANDRSTIIGTLPSNIRVQSFPASFPISAYVVISPQPPEDTIIRVQVEVSGAYELDISAPVPAPSQPLTEFSATTLTVTGEGTVFKAAGDFSIILTIGDHTPARIGKVHISGP